MPRRHGRLRQLKAASRSVRRRDLDCGQPPESGGTGPRLPHDERTGIKVTYTAGGGHSDVWSVGDCAAVQTSTRRARSFRDRAGRDSAGAPGRPNVLRSSMVMVILESSNTSRSAARRAGKQLRRQRGDGVRFTGMFAAVFCEGLSGAPEQPQSKVRVAADWIVGLFCGLPLPRFGTSEE